MILSVKFHLVPAAKNVGGVFAKCWVFWPKKEGVTGGQRYLHNKHYSVYMVINMWFSQNVGNLFTESASTFQEKPFTVLLFILLFTPKS